jgi:UDP-glucose 4-epimerase
MKENRTILITGGRGFVGSHLCNHLEKKGVDIVGKDNRYQVEIPLDVTQLSPLLSINADVEAVIHLAGKTSINKSLISPHETYYTNLVGTLNLLEFARQKDVSKFIYMSTYIYGKPHYLPIDENHPIDPHSPYSESKLVSEKLCQFYSHDYGIDIVTLRPFYLYGSYTRANSLIHCILDQLMNRNGRVTLSGKQTKRDFLFIDDFQNLIEIVLKKFPRGYNVYNVGYGKSYTLTRVSQILAKLMQKKITIHYDTEMRPGDIVNMVADISKISKWFDWKPTTTLEQGLESTAKDYLLHQ